MVDPRHVPVLLDRVVELLAPALSAPDAVLVDATIGLGGHAEAVLALLPDVHVIGVDRDEAALEATRERLTAYGDRVTLVRAVYDEIESVLTDRGRPCANAILFDLGVSSMQLDVVERGFSYSTDAPLDMRMGGTSDERTAADVLNTYSAHDLASVLRVNGEERFARRIAEAVVAARDEEPFDTSARLVELIRSSIPAAARRTGGNPAKRTFQALRIEVNDELAALRRALPAAVDAVCVGGRIVAMAYHSLEDRIVKRAFTSVTSVDLPPGLPVVPPDLAPRFRLLTRGSEMASAAEISANRRARSVRLRAVERIAA